MADKKITELTNITGANLADADEFVVVDSSASETKAITWAELKNGLDTSAGFVRVTGDTMTGDLTINGDLTATGGDLDLDTLDLKAIAASKAVTAVDVFVYDTSKDSDGGAWRKRTQHTSWYNETLNTATRGSRREFPAVAVIVAEASKLTIYDGDDPSLPMWMVFNSGTTNLLILGGGYFVTGGLYCLNGVLTATTPGVAEGSLKVINFVADTGNVVSQFTPPAFSANYTGKYNGNISLRNSGLGFSASSGYLSSAIVNRTVNDVAMTVLPDAPIDPATGLPVPTIAVATAGGVSVIKDDGTVVDIPTSGTATNWVGFNDRHQLASDGNYDDRWVLREIPPADVANLETVDATFVAKPYRQYGQSADYQRQVNFGDTYASDLGNIKNGLLLEYGAGSALGSTSLVALLTSAYNTGWMNGDIKGAFLSSTDATSLVGSGELVTNGTFDTDTSGWTLVQTGGSSATLTQSSGKALVTLNGSYDVGMYQAFTTVVGKTYTLVQTMGLVTAFNANATGRVSTFIGTAINGSQNAQQEVTGIDGVTVNLTFTATATTTYVTIRSAGSGNTTGAFTVDNISVKLADADRSVNNKGLIVNGTITRSAVATGAELVAYSGFSSSNYLEQPYNSALDFGTGDFCVMGWFKANSTAAERTIISRYASDSAAPDWRLQLDAANKLDFRVDTSSVLLSAGVFGSDTWRMASVVRASGIIYLYADGVLLGSVANSVSLTNASARLGLGITPVATPIFPFTGSLALWRISATAPTAEQIRKIYEDEKVLFQENAACTLYGASDAVTALAHDSDTGLLHVGTSAGRSVFQGLRRVSNTTTAVGTAISASNGLVVEE